MEAVASQADVTKPTLYAYFSSKEELAVEAFIESVDARLALIEKLSATLSPLERFRHVLRYSLMEKISEEQIILSWPGPPISTNPKFTARFHQLVDATVDLVKEAQEVGEVNPALDPYVVVKSYNSLLTDAHLETALRARDISSETIIETLYTVLTVGLTPPRTD